MLSTRIYVKFEVPELRQQMPSHPVFFSQYGNCMVFYDLRSDPFFYALSLDSRLYSVRHIHDSNKKLIIIKNPK